MKRKRGKRKPKIFICILKERHNEYVEIIANTLPLANAIAEKAYPSEIDFLYKAQRYSGSNLTKIETLTKED